MGVSACLFRGVEYCLLGLHVTAVLFWWPTGNLAPMCRETFWHRPRERKQGRGGHCEKMWVILKAGKQPGTHGEGGQQVQP